MFRKRKHDKLQKAVETIKILLQESPKKGASVPQEKHENFFNDIYDSLTSSEPIAKEELLAAVDILFIASGSSKSSLQIKADQTLNKAFRVLWLKGQVQKVITLILNELNQSQERTWKSVAVAYNKLVYYVQFSRASKNEAYALYYINSVGVAIKRPEDGIQTTISKTFATTMKHLGPFISDKVEDKVFELFENAVKNLELSGTSGRVASLVLAELSIYNKKVLEKSVKVINRIIKAKNEISNKRMIVNALTTLRLIWSTIVKNSSRFSTLILQAMVLQILKMLLSPSNELIVAALEALEILFATPCNILIFVPSELPASSGPASEYGSPMRTPRRFSKGAITDQIAQWELLGSPWGSVNDISMEEPSYQAQTDASAASADARSTTGSLNETASETAETSQMFTDPLINATQASDTISLLDASQNTKFSRLSGYLHIMLNGLNPMKIKGTLDALKNTINYLILDDHITYVHGIEALIVNHNLTSLLDVWFSNPSLTSFQNSLILNLVEVSSSNISVDNLVTILNVLSYLLETKEFTAEAKTTEHSKNASKTKVKLEMRVILVFLRVINLYYTVYVENKAKQNAPSTAALFIPESPSKQDENRTNDISYLVGTGVHQMKGANYNDSPALKSLESTIQGSYKNFMDTLDIEIQNRFLSPLIACLNGLERILPKFAFQDVNIFLDELLLYINRLMPFVVAPATGVLSELLKVLFGRNLSISSSPEKPHHLSHSLSFSHKDLLCKSFEDFAYFLTKLSSPDYVEEGVLNHFSIIYCRTQAKQTRVSFETVTDVLRRFEK
uniref:Uncharacterized protein n=1 Tax=Panagrolaimus sp. PS1159 TaxID=55785 RepID=A0AC35EYY5_9BILA